MCVCVCVYQGGVGTWCYSAHMCVYVYMFVRRCTRVCVCVYVRVYVYQGGVGTCRYSAHMCVYVCVRMCACA